METNSKKMVIGFIGNGKSANRYHMPYLMRRRDKIQVRKIYARHIRHDWPVVDGAEYTDNLDALLHDPEIQVVTISTPSAFHYDYAKQALMAGKNCVVEKPFAESSAEARELFALAKERGLVVMCYQNRRFDSDFLTAQKVIRSGVLGDLLEVEMHYDYFRPYIPEGMDHFDKVNSFLYGHGCHTLDQVISFFGGPERIHYDVRQLLGTGRMNDYFDLDLYYGKLKVSVKSSYFRLKERPSFIVYGKKGVFVKQEKDRQEADLKKFYLPDHDDFGLDTPEQYGVLSYMDDQGVFHEEKVPSVRGDYGRYYDALYETVMNGKPKLVKDSETLLQLEILEKGIQGLQ